jgi:hypothetical protein
MFVYRFRLFCSTVLPAVSYSEWRTFTTAETRILSMPVHAGFVQGKVAVGEVSLRLQPTLVLLSTWFPEKVGVNKN